MLADEILDELHRQMPFLAKATERAFGAPLAERKPEIERIAQRLAEIGDPDWIPGSVKAYVLLSLETLKLQRELEKTGRYLLGSEREAFERVYNRGDVIGFYYLAGLLLSQALWTTHYGLGRAYRETFLPQLAPGARVLEVGVGTGYHLRDLFLTVPDVRYDGVDISPYSIEFARRFAFGDDTPERARFTLTSATAGLPFPDATFDAAICGEVIEHVERPGDLLREIGRVLKPGAPFFMTTAIFEANIDHIYLFEDAQSVRDLVAESGFAIESEWILPIYDDPPDAVRRPLSYGAVLRGSTISASR